MNTTPKHGLPALLLISLLGACGADEEGSLDMEAFDPGEGITQDAPAGRALITTKNGELEVGYDVVGGRALMEGDIDLGPVDELRRVGDGSPRSNTNLVSGAQFPGPNIFYVKPTFNQAAIIAAMDEISAKTDVNFLQLPAAVPGLFGIQFAKSTDEGVSSSAVGFQGGFQTIKIWPTHGKGVVEHEVLHALGMWHEQQRLDRNAFIDLNLGCVWYTRWHNFDAKGLPLGPYDFKSIMHYGSFAFAITPSCVVMSKKDGSTFTGNSVLSAGDILAINALY